MCIQKGITLSWIHYTSTSGTAWEGLLHGSYLNTFTIHLHLPSVPSTLGYVTGHCQFIAINFLPSTHHKSLLDCKWVVFLQAWWLQDKRKEGLQWGEISFFKSCWHSWEKQPVIRICCPFTKLHIILMQKMLWLKKQTSLPSGLRWPTWLC